MKALSLQITVIIDKHVASYPHNFFCLWCQTTTARQSQNFAKRTGTILGSSGSVTHGVQCFLVLGAELGSVWGMPDTHSWRLARCQGFQVARECLPQGILPPGSSSQWSISYMRTGDRQGLRICPLTTMLVVCLFLQGLSVPMCSQCTLMDDDL